MLKYSCLLYTDLVSCNLAELVYSKNFLVDSLGFSIYKIMSCTDRGNFTFLFQLGAFYIVFLPNALARTSIAVLNRSSESGHPCLVWNLRRKLSSLLPLSMI